MHKLQLQVGGERFNYPSFNKYLLEICDKHRREKRASAFVLIVHDFTNPEIIKVLGDRNYFNALNIISGKHLTVFYIDLEGVSPHPIKQVSQVVSGEADDTEAMSFMTAIPVYDELVEEVISFIHKIFGQNTEWCFPFLIFFQSDGKKILDQLQVKIKSDEIEPAFNEIRKYVKITADLVKGQPINTDNDYITLFKNLKDKINECQTDIVQGKFPTPSGTEWSDIKIQMVDDYCRIIAPNHPPKRFSYSELSFLDKRRGNQPNMLWEILFNFAKGYGEYGTEKRYVPKKQLSKDSPNGLDYDDHINKETRSIRITRTPLSSQDIINFKTNLTRLRKKLRSLFPGITGDPLPYYKGVYKAKFQIEPLESLAE